MIFTFLHYLLSSSFFFRTSRFIKKPYVWLYSYSHYVETRYLWKAYLNIYVRNKKNTHFKISSRVFTRLFFFFSSWDEISSRQKRVNSKRHFTIDRDDFIPGRVSSRYEMSRINTLLPCVEILVFNKDSSYEPATSVKWFSEQVTSRNALSNKLCQKVNLTWV